MEGRTANNRVKSRRKRTGKKFPQLYNIADSLVAGKFIGEKALAAVGNSYEITLIFIAFAFGCNIGCSVITAQLFGAKDYGKMKTAVYTALIFSAVLCLLLMGGGILFSSHLLKLIQTPTEIFADSQLYLDIYIWGIPFLPFRKSVSTAISHNFNRIFIHAYKLWLIFIPFLQFFQ
ncbi:MAG: MATE family efflux transporter [Lachnospiraceae bacterium]